MKCYSNNQGTKIQSRHPEGNDTRKGEMNNLPTPLYRILAFFVVCFEGLPSGSLFDLFVD
jgi:hypothetical protein